jgi:hypothetical protein
MCRFGGYGITSDGLLMDGRRGRCVCGLNGYASVERKELSGCLRYLGDLLDMVVSELVYPIY